MRQVLQHLRKMVVDLQDEIKEAKRVIEMNEEKIEEYKNAIEKLEGGNNANE